MFVYTGDVGVAYRKLVECMLTAADRTIGKKTKVGGGRERGLSHRQKKLIASRNQAGKEWRKECVTGGERVEAKWKQFLRKKVLVARNWQKDRRKRRIKWRIKSLGKGKGHIKEIWRDLKVGKTGGGGGGEIKVLQVEGDKVVTEPELIRKEIEKYMAQLTWQ